MSDEMFQEYIRSGIEMFKELNNSLSPRHGHGGPGWYTRSPQSNRQRTKGAQVSIPGTELPCSTDHRFDLVIRVANGKQPIRKAFDHVDHLEMQFVG